MKRFATSICISVLLWNISWAGGGPAQVAKVDRSLWPYAIHSTAEFDFASKMEMLVFVRMLDQLEKTSNEDSLKKYVGLQNVSMTSIQTWKEQTKRVFLANFANLKDKLPHDYIPLPKPLAWPSLVVASHVQESKMPTELKVWYEAAQKFYARYLYEQLRLAALFPRTTSEILTLQPSELTGFEMSDKQFLLTFDDGPTVKGGNTDKLIATLNQYRLSGLFFVLGDMYKARLKATSASQLHDLYGKNVVGSHARIHKPHQKYEAWESSLSFTAKVSDSVVPENNGTKYFRPPYGQRNEGMVNYLSKHNTKVMLWNIDSQDWSNKITADEMVDRVSTLMLLWRRGILLFHDIHPKCNDALPAILKYFEGSGVVWADPKL